MTYSRENDELRREIAPSASASESFTFWPKIDGVNVLAMFVGDGSSGTVSPTYEVFTPAGVSIYSSGSLTPTDSGTPSVSQLSIAVSASLIPSLASMTALAEDYFIKISWRLRGDTTYSRPRIDVIYFDVVLYPFGPPSVSLNDLLEERPDVGEVLDRMGQLLGYASGATAQTSMAGVFATRARVELDALIRDAVGADAAAVAGGSYTNTTRIRPTPIQRFTRPNLILNRERLNRVERKLAMQLVYAADMTEPEGPEEAAGLFRHYKAEAERAWRGVGPLKYAEFESFVPDTTLTELSRVISLRRRQA